jgi:hypothetical protein
MKYLVSVLVACLYIANANAVSVTNATSSAGLSAPVLSAVTTDDAAKIRTIATLEDDITILDSEISKCEKSKKGWIAATVIGSAGVVATGVAAGVQGAQIADKKKELAQHNQDIADKQQQLNELNGQDK